MKKLIRYIRENPDEARALAPAVINITFILIVIAFGISVFIERL